MDARIAFPWERINLTASALVATGKGVLHSINLNIIDSKGAIIVYDGIDTNGELLGAVTTGFDQPRLLLYDLKYSTGLYILFLGAWDITVSYK